MQDNPSSAEAIQAAREDICLIAEDDIMADKAALTRVARMAMRVENGGRDLTPEQLGVRPHFKSPMLNSVAASADAALKIASVDEGFGGSREFYEMQGFDSDRIDRIMGSRNRAEAARLAGELLGE